MSSEIYIKKISTATFELKRLVRVLLINESFCNENGKSCHNYIACRPGKSTLENDHRESERDPGINFKLRIVTPFRG